MNDPKPNQKPPRKLGEMMGGTTREAIECSPLKTAREDMPQARHDGAPLAFWAYLAIAGVCLGLMAAGALSDQWEDGPAYACAAFLLLAELSLIRRAYELAGDRAKERMGWPHCKPPLENGASAEKRALAWMDIGCRLNEQGEHIRASSAWGHAEDALRDEGEIP